MKHRDMYPEVWRRVTERLAAKGQVHGSEVRDMFVEHAAGRFSVDDHAERLLSEGVRDGLLTREARPRPTHSQAAFAGLQYSASSYRAQGWAPGLREHFWYFDARVRPDCVGREDE